MASEGGSGGKRANAIGGKVNASDKVKTADKLKSVPTSDPRGLDSLLLDPFELSW